MGVCAANTTPKAAKSDPAAFVAVPPLKSMVTVFARDDATTSASAKTTPLVTGLIRMNHLLKLTRKGDRLIEFPLDRIVIFLFSFVLDC